jgi:hypothetical protein
MADRRTPGCDLTLGWGAEKELAGVLLARCAFPGATPFVHHSRANLRTLIRVNVVAGLARF